jgi:hypothetical protein
MGVGGFDLDRDVEYPAAVGQRSQFAFADPLRPLEQRSLALATSACALRPGAASPALPNTRSPRPAARRAVRPVRYGLRDDGGMIGLRSTLLVVLVVAAAALSACGSSSTSSSSSTATSTTAGSGSGVAAAKQKCLDATKKIQDSSARSTAEHACNQITTSNANVSTALSKAKQACITAAAKIPIASLKHAAEAQCNKIAAQ